MIRLSLISAILLLMTMAQSSYASRCPAMAYDPKLGPTSNQTVAIAVSQAESKSNHVCPYQTNKICAGGGLMCDTNPPRTRPVVGGGQGKGVY